MDARAARKERARAREQAAKKGALPTKAERRETPRQSRRKAAREDEEDSGADDLLPEAQPVHPRNEVDAKAAVRQNALHVFGLDFLKTGHLDEIFGQFDHKFIEWINDSTANIIFNQAANAKKALEALSFPKAGDEPWRRTPDIIVSEDMPPIFLQMRLATTSDAKRPKKAMPAIATWATSKLGKDVSTKRPREPPTQEELAARRKRATRFADWLKALPAPASPEVKVKAAEAAEAKAAEAGDDDVAAPAAPPGGKVAIPKPPPVPEGLDLGDDREDDEETRAARRRARPPQRLAGLEVTEEELAKRRKRAERFEADAKDGAAVAEKSTPAREGEVKEKAERVQEEKSPGGDA